MAVGGQLLLQWETYLLHILWNLCGKPKRGRQEAFFFFFVLWVVLSLSVGES